MLGTLVVWALRSVLSEIFGGGGPPLWECCQPLKPVQPRAGVLPALGPWAGHLLSRSSVLLYMSREDSGVVITEVEV